MRDEPVSHQYATRFQLPSQRYSEVILPLATFSWFAGVCFACALPRYWRAQAGQFEGMIWYLPYAPGFGFLAL